MHSFSKLFSVICCRIISIRSASKKSKYSCSQETKTKKPFCLQLAIPDFKKYIVLLY